MEWIIVIVILLAIVILCGVILQRISQPEETPETDPNLAVIAGGLNDLEADTKSLRQTTASIQAQLDDIKVLCGNGEVVQLLQDLRTETLALKESLKPTSRSGSRRK